MMENIIPARGAVFVAVIGQRQIDFIHDERHLMCAAPVMDACKFCRVNGGACGLDGLAMRTARRAGGGMALDMLQRELKAAVGIDWDVTARASQNRAKWRLQG